MKFLKVFIAFTMLCSICAPMGITVNAEPVVKTECINVAENKPITSNALHNNTWPITNLVDGNRMTFVPAEYTSDSQYSAANEEIVVDLLRRYKIDRVELYNSVDVDREGGRQGFEILGANNEDFSDSVLIGRKDEVISNEIFPPTGCFTAEANEVVCRYIKIKRTVWGYYGYGELKVFAEQTATEVAQGKPAVANYWYEFMEAFSPEHANNGTNDIDYDCWIAEAASVPNYYFWRVDLEEPMHIGMIEFEGRNFSTTTGSDNPVTRKYNDVYGSNTNAENSVLEQNAELVGIGDYKRLIKTTENEEYNGECQFPMITNNTNREMFQSTVDDSVAYRYLTYKKSYLCFAALGAFRAYVINPVINSNTINAQEITVNFSDEMDASSFDAESVKVFVNNEPVEAVMNFADDYTLKLTLSEMYYSSQIKVVIDKTVNNMKNVNLAENAVLLFSTPPAVDVTEFKIQNAKSGEGEEITSLSGLSEVGVKVSVSNNKIAERERAVVLLLLYNENNALVKADVKKLSLDPAPAPALSCTAGFDLPQNTEGFSLKAYIWRDFSLMQRLAEGKILQ